MPDNDNQNSIPQTELMEETSAQTEEVKEDYGATATESTEEEIATEEEIESAQMQTGGGLGNLLTPEGIIMMGLAVTLDVVGLVINLCALDDCGILDIVGIVIICGWMLFRSQGKSVTATGKTKKQAENFLKKIFTGKNSKFITPIVGEIIPYVGALPCWTLAVFFEVTEIEVPGLTSDTKQQGSAAPTANLNA
jgi:hypothetical protein